MPNVAKVLKDEILRLARKVVRTPMAEVRRENVALRRRLAELRKRIARVERDTRQLMAAQRRQAKEATQTAEREGPAMRVSSRGILALRRKLKLSQAGLAKLVGVTPLSVYQWERKGGRLALRRATLQALASIRGLGIREARQRLEEQAKVKKGGRRKKRRG